MLLGDDVIGRLVVGVLGNRNKAGRWEKTDENGREGKVGGEKEKEGRTRQVGVFRQMLLRWRMRNEKR